MINLLADTLRTLLDQLEHFTPSTVTETWSKEFLKRVAEMDNTILGKECLPRKLSDDNSASIHYKGYADVLWLCTVGFGCVCGEECR